MTKTIRQTMVALLEQQALSTLNLADILLLKEKEVADHLEHISRSLRPHKLLVVESARCKKCGFQFKKRTRLNPPSRCPHCKGESIERARFSIG
jgi:predicted Zn-ribbon and HTH transcriptional regulator